MVRRGYVMAEQAFHHLCRNPLESSCQSGSDINICEYNHKMAVTTHYGCTHSHRYFLVISLVWELSVCQK